ncbi:creatininase family protein [Xylanimonas oleitrophica]|uniref:Creatininase family protein n=1 Tax=Xylanimonas oleitrophica TaxID=2607479 RepID=A0A2W5WXE1_9MICO|nr:creatininase family protein [Xylanimonas oleitrophica]PZR55322.1 creatininase family protein [Xylanimonas oleitrophica]
MTRWNELTWPQVREAVERQPVAILALGAVEEHGPHLPLGTDVYAAEAFSARIAEAADLLELPVLPYGQVWSLEHFDGSLSISDATLVSLLVELAAGLQQVGVKGLVLYSAHLGNAAAMKSAVRRLEETGGLPAIALTYPGLSAVADQVAQSPRSHPAIMHADELETSVMLAVREDLVHMDRAVREYPDYPPHFEAAPLRWDTLSSSGVFGDATAATQEKGRRIVDHVVATAAEIVGAWKEGLR